MKYLLSSLAIIAAVAIAAPAWAQRTSPGPGAWTGSGPGVVPPGGYGPSSSYYNLPQSSAYYYAAPYNYGWPYYYGSSYYYGWPYYGSTYSPYYYGSPYNASPSSYYYGPPVR
jgi:hypothetical protein